MNLIIETDLGHDPDDLLAICYLVSAGVKIRLITIVPGDPDQIAIAQLLRDRLGLDCPIGASKLDRDKLSSGSIHHDLLYRYDRPLQAKPDGQGHVLVEQTLAKYPDCEFLAIGPVTSIGTFLGEHKHKTRATMQGGFLPYRLNPHAHLAMWLPKFIDQEWVPTFNLNGDRKAALKFITADLDRQFVGKHVCHLVIFNQNKLVNFVPKDVASELFVEALQLYLRRHDEKKLHDPTAAVCHLHPEIATWIRGKVVKREGGWTTELDKTGDQIIANIDHDALWQKLWRFE